jgi:hypothetical protein
MTIEQSQLENVFELLQALRQGWLTDAQGCRRLQETAVCLHGVHRPQQREPEALIEVSVGHPAASAGI